MRRSIAAAGVAILAGSLLVVSAASATAARPGGDPSIVGVASAERALRTHASDVRASDAEIKIHA